MDVLSDVLSAMRVGQPSAQRSSSRAPWGVRFAPGDAAACHVILQGACWLVPDHGSPLSLGLGDVVFTWRGEGHALVDRPGSPTVDFVPDPGRDAAPGMPEPRGEPGAATEMLCASYRFDDVRPHPLLADLPGIIHLPARIGQHASLRTVVELMGDELLRPRAGTAGVLPALVDILLLYVLRAWLDERSGHAGAGWATALGDPGIAPALRAMHRHPERPWTVEELAARAGLSRAAFAKRFTTLVGQPPLTYLTWWRMTTAARLLRGSDTPLRAVAERSGYGSEFAFAKAFKRAYGTAPGRYRREGGTR